ncbi:MAG: hypothetical protein IKL52_06940 [Candidatus Gastranaerophilales bacterium]|nr:hypothetical protein [Candidatus Gastranaerophilales bacterium]
MRIAPISNFQYKPNFKSTTRTTYISDSDGVFVLPTYNRQLQNTASFSTKKDVRMVASNSTSFFRRDIDWKSIGSTFDSQFPKGKVNIYDFACSDGSEAYSLIITLIEQLGEKKAQRFFPIVASDIDGEIISMANSGKIMATQTDLFLMGNIIKDGKIKKYFSVTELGGDQYLLSPKRILTKNVVFKQQPISRGLDEIQKDEQNIILARNFWKYLSREEMATASWKIGEKTNDKTLLVVGNFDIPRDEQTPFFLKALGYDSIRDLLNMNILEFKKDRVNYIATKNRETWQSYIANNYGGYIPSYIR